MTLAFQMQECVDKQEQYEMRCREAERRGLILRDDRTDDNLSGSVAGLI
jgi:hypothetical protein